MTFATMFQLKILNFKIKLWQLPIKLTCLLYWYIVENIFQLGGHIAEYSCHQQCLQVELPTMLVNNVKHVSTEESFLKYS
jgi:hypothetical protein